jgi:hypothetical protein
MAFLLFGNSVTFSYFKVTNVKENVIVNIYLLLFTVILNTREEIHIIEYKAVFTSI